MSFKFIVTLDGVEKMRGGLTQATLFLITHYGSVDEGINAGVRIRPEWLSTPLIPSSKTSAPAARPGSLRRMNPGLQDSGARAMNA